MVARYIPQAGDIVWIDFSPTKGHEQRGRRPAVVISVHAYTKASGLCTVCPITSQTKGYPNEVAIVSKHVSGAVLVDQHKTIDVYARTLAKAGKVNAATLLDIRTRIGIILGITQ
jgi:mRNA interferase MazF